MSCRVIGQKKLRSVLGLENRSFFSENPGTFYESDYLVVKMVLSRHNTTSCTYVYFEHRLDANSSFPLDLMYSHRWINSGNYCAWLL